MKKNCLHFGSFKKCFADYIIPHYAIIHPHIINRHIYYHHYINAIIIITTTNIINMKNELHSSDILSCFACHLKLLRNEFC